MEIERSLFRDEEELATAVIKHKYPQAQDEFIERWLTRWWNNKKHLIQVMGGIRMETPIEADDTGAEESEDSEDTNENHNRLLNDLFSKIDRNRHPTYFFMAIDEPDKTVAAFLSRLDTAGIPVGLYWNGQRLPTPEISMVGRIFDSSAGNPTQSDLRRRAVRSGWLEEGVELPEQFMYVDFTQFLSRLVQSTPVETIMKGRLESGMKLGKFLKQMFPPDRILFKGMTTTQVGGGELEWTARPFHDAFDIIWSQVIQEFRCIGTMVLSAAPVDLITLSVTSTWSSCCSFKGGQAAIGGLAYAVDKSTLVGYVPRTNPVEEFGVSFPDKQWRSICHVDLPNGTAVFGKHYPNNNPHNAKALRKAVNHMLADHHGVSRTWKKCNGSAGLKSAPKYIYSETGGPRTRLKEMDDRPVNITYGVDHFDCFQCGHELNTACSLTCVVCNGRGERGSNDPIQHADPDLEYHCPFCGDDYPGDVMIWYANDGTFICEYCRQDDFYACDNCGELLHRDNTYSAGDDTYCEDCFQEHYFHCDHCGDVAVQDDGYWIEGAQEHWCEYCAERDSTFCDSCHERSPDGDAHYATAGGETICQGCYEDGWFTCFDCEDIYHGDDGIYVEDIEADVCRDCVENSGNYFECEGCTEVYTTEEEAPVYSISKDRTVNLCTTCADAATIENEKRKEVI